jgi:4-amino-4-deoxy-L-arabinose transferase-like glycosyltransferase
MEQVIYTASTLQAFGKNIVMLLIIWGLAVFAIVMTKNKSHPLLVRVWLGFCAVVMIATALFLATVSVRDIQAGPRQFTFIPQEKEVETHTNKGHKSYVYVVRPDQLQPTHFAVPKSVYDQISLDGCYRFTFYGQASWIVPIEEITEIRQLERQQCPGGSPER